MQYPLRLPHTPQPGELMLEDFGIALTSCAVCNTRLALRDAPKAGDGEHLCRKTECRSIYEGWVAA